MSACIVCRKRTNETTRMGTPCCFDCKPSFEELKDELRRAPRVMMTDPEPFQDIHTIEDSEARRANMIQVGLPPGVRFYTPRRDPISGVTGAPGWDRDWNELAVPDRRRRR